MQTKTTMRYHFTPVRMGITQKNKQPTNPQVTNVGEDMEKREPSYTVGGNGNWCSHCGKMKVSQKAKTRATI